jgi:hypothetical protein
MTRTGGPARLARAARRAGRRIAATAADCGYAQRRLAELQTGPDSYLLDAGRAPETYQEFLFRTSGVLVREPTAARRASGRKT